MLKISGVMWSNFEIKIICIVSGTMQTHPEDMKKYCVIILNEDFKKY